MRQKSTQRYCAPPHAIAAMKRDGLGWGHDLECGMFVMGALPRRSVLARLFKKEV